MRVEVSDELRAHVADHGGCLYVRPRSSHCCSGVLTVLVATTDRPDDLDGFRTMAENGLRILFRSTGGPDPDVLVLTLEGRRRPRPAAYWNGAALVL
jgi:hypothetical protein